MDVHRAAGDPGNGGVHVHRRRAGDAAVELAAADAVRLARDYVLAGARTASALPDSFWRVRTPWVQRLEYSGAHSRAACPTPGSQYAPRTGTLPSGPGRP